VRGEKNNYASYGKNALKKVFLFNYFKHFAKKI